jgi:hypothetical protein
MDILKKLDDKLRSGIETEADALYFLAEIRKFLEQQALKQTYEYLRFHCDWAVHAKLSGPMAQRVLEEFDKANIHLKRGVELRDLPGGLRGKIDRLSKLKYFEGELQQFLLSHSLPDLSERRSDGWTHFLHLYIKVVEGCPLQISAQNNTATIEKVTLRFELANKPIGDEMLYKISWDILDKNGLTGEIFIINSFSLKPE